MTGVSRLTAVASITLSAFGIIGPVQAQQSAMSFFVTSVGLGKGGDLGGLEGADRPADVGAATFRVSFSAEPWRRS